LTLDVRDAVQYRVLIGTLPRGIAPGCDFGPVGNRLPELLSSEGYMKGTLT